jgi:hypothetical protein
MNSDLLKYLSEKLNNEIKHIGDDIARGTAKDHGEYKWACGIVRGLTMANTIIAETAQHMENDDD